MYVKCNKKDTCCMASNQRSHPWKDEDLDDVLLPLSALVHKESTDWCAHLGQTTIPASAQITSLHELSLIAHLRVIGVNGIQHRLFLWNIPSTSVLAYMDGKFWVICACCLLVVNTSKQQASKFLLSSNMYLRFYL